MLCIQGVRVVTLNTGLSYAACDYVKDAVIRSTQNVYEGKIPSINDHTDLVCQTAF